MFCMRRSIVLLLLLVLLAFACTPHRLPAPTVNGTWESIGSGWILQIQDSAHYSFYDIVTSACLPSRYGAFDELATELSLQEDTLRLKKGVITYEFVRILALPKMCKTPLAEDKLRDPMLNFEVFAETVAEHYAFFEESQIDWEALYQTQKSKLTAQPGDVELYAAIAEIQEQLQDNHASLEVPEEIEVLLEQESEEMPEAALPEKQQGELPEYGDFKVADSVFYHHIQEDLTSDSWMLRWGKLTDDLGYVQIKAMWLYADLGAPEENKVKGGYVAPYVTAMQQLYEGEYIRREVEAVSQVMDRAMHDLTEMDAIVIDVRFNGGGQDAVSFEVLSRFTPEKTQVATQKLRLGAGYTPTLPLYVDGTAGAYTKPVFVLTSPQTGSAAEAFALATMSLPHVRRVGSSTAGALSTALEKKLPNGWAFSLSNEVYMDTNGQAYEHRGIPVDLSLGYLTERQPFFREVVNDLEGDKRSILDAIAELQRP